MTTLSLTHRVAQRALRGSTDYETKGEASTAQKLLDAQAELLRKCSKDIAEVADIFKTLEGPLRIPWFGKSAQKLEVISEKCLSVIDGIERLGLLLDDVEDEYADNVPDEVSDEERETLRGKLRTPKILSKYRNTVLTALGKLMDAESSIDTSGSDYITIDEGVGQYLESRTLSSDLDDVYGSIDAIIDDYLRYVT